MTPEATISLVIFGGAGDLAHRKLLPALYNLHVDGLLPRIAIVGVGRKNMTDEAYRAFAQDGVTRFSRRPIDAPAWAAFEASLFFVNASIDDQRAFAPLGARLDIIEHEQGLTGDRIYYLAVPPSLFAPTVKGLARARMVLRPASGSVPAAAPFARVIAEKPIGRDLESACAINDAVAEVFDERQIYRIDHYLGKETVQNILVLRFANSIFEPLLNQKYVDHVQITVAESIGIEERAEYYDHAGAMRDIVQNHLLQLMALVAMEPPSAFDDRSVRDEKVKVLRALRPIPQGEVAARTVRGQYAAGFNAGAPVPRYRDGDGVAPDSRTETIVALRCLIDNWRWQGIPFYLRTGKRLPKRSTEIAIRFRVAPHRIFTHESSEGLDANELVLRIQPDEGISLTFGAKVPVQGFRIRAVNMDFVYGAAFMVDAPDAYETLILDALRGDATLFTRRDEVEQQWAFVDPILEAWGNGVPELSPYPAGSWGPPEAETLIERDGRTWRRP